MPPPGSVSAQLSPLGTFGEGSLGLTGNTDPGPVDPRHEMEHLQTARARRGTEQKVICPLTPILSDLCPSLQGCHISEFLWTINCQKNNSD